MAGVGAIGGLVLANIAFHRPVESPDIPTSTKTIAKVVQTKPLTIADSTKTADNSDSNTNQSKTNDNSPAPTPATPHNDQQLIQNVPDNTETDTPGNTDPTPLVDPIPDSPQISLVIEDPNVPGKWLVNDKQTVMTRSGIPADEQADASDLIDSVSRWVYIMPFMPDWSLCHSTNRNTGDYIAPDPIVQLTYCNKSVQEVYGNWHIALEIYNTMFSMGFGMNW